MYISDNVVHYIQNSISNGLLQIEIFFFDQKKIYNKGLVNYLFWSARFWALDVKSLIRVKNESVQIALKIKFT